MKMRCLSCRKTKPDSAFGSHRSRRCQECSQPTPCTVCGTLCPPERKTCMSASCLDVARSRAAHLAGEARAQRAAEMRAKRKTHRCGNCRKVFPLGSDQLRPTKRNPDGSVARYHSYCCKCYRAYARIVYAVSDEARAKRVAASRLHHQRLKERMERDPQFAAEYRAWRADVSRQYRERKKKEAALPDPKPMPRGGPELEARSFLAWLEKVAVRYETERDCWAALGVSERRVADWRTGKAKYVRFDVADEAFQNEGNTFIWEIYEQFSPFEEEELIAA